MQKTIAPDLKKCQVLDMGIHTTAPTQATDISTSMAVYEVSQKYAGRGDKTTTIIIAAVVGAVVGTGVVAAGIAVLVCWWCHHHDRKSNTLIRRITDLGRLQHVKARKTRMVPETAYRTLGRKSVS